MLAPSLAAAQANLSSNWPIEAGSRVRISSPVFGNKQQTGSVVSATSDTLVFMPSKQSTSTAISTPNIVELEVARGTHTSKLKGALLGFLLGAGSGAAIGSATYRAPNCTDFCFDMFGRDGNIAVGAVLGGLGGTITGLLIGSRHSDTWETVAVPKR
jgi:hypothetical protein